MGYFIFNFFKLIKVAITQKNYCFISNSHKIHNLVCLSTYASHVNESYTELSHSSNMYTCPHWCNKFQLKNIEFWEEVVYQILIVYFQDKLRLSTESWGSCQVCQRDPVYRGCQDGRQVCIILTYTLFSLFYVTKFLITNNVIYH